VDKEEGRQGYLSACDLPENTRGEVMGEVGEPASSARGRGVMGGRGGAQRRVMRQVFAPGGSVRH
jgi:hypothetical protein